MRYAAILLIAAAVLTAGCRRTVVTTPDLQVLGGQKTTLDPNASVWSSPPVHGSKLILQDLVEPRLMESSTGEIRVQAITDGKEVAFRLEWVDKSKNEASVPHGFIDACAVQIPAVTADPLPAPQMGETGRTVQISYWRADWQAIVEGRADEITGLYPNAKPDHYPFEAKPLENDPEAKRRAALRYSPARALGNQRQGPREQPVEDLIAEGPGTLTPAPAPVSKGKGTKTRDGWAVVIVRPVPEGFTKERPTQIAFAVWEGSHGETGARKMRTGWVNMILK